MECLACDNKEVVVQNLRFENELKGELLEFIAPVFKCQECGEVLSTTDQKRVGMVNLADAYRKKHGLLTSSEIKKYRENLGKSQDQFANFLGVGIASVKRWESYTVQDPSNNELIKLKCDPEYAEAHLVSNLLTLEPQHLNGNRRFSPEIFAQVLSRVLPLTGSPLFFFKSIFYIDFLHWKRCGTSITGATYRALEYGPVPAHYESILAYLSIKKWFSKTEGYNFEISEISFDSKNFSTEEIATIDTIVEILESKGKQYVFEKSHGEAAYTETTPFSTIQYELASKLSIS